MKDLIKNILLEHTEMVPPNSWPGESWNPTAKKYSKQAITKVMFTKGVKLIVKYNSLSEIDDIIDNGQSPYDRAYDIVKWTKLIGINANSEGLNSKILWAAKDNYDGIKNGSITSYDQLELRPLLTFKTKMFEDLREYKTVYWTVETDDFSAEDTENRIMYDDDGAYSYWEQGIDDEETHETDSEDRGTSEPPEEIGIVFQHSSPGEDRTEEGSDQITESLKAGPEENDIISELEELLNNKTLTENNVRNILKKYKSKPLTEEWGINDEKGKAETLNQQPITIIEAKFMTKIKEKFDSIVLAKWAASTHYSLSDVQELKSFTRAFGISNQLRTSQLINLIWDNMDLDEFSSFVGELAPKLQYVEIIMEYEEITEGIYRATVGSWGVDYETNACQLKDDFWNYDPDLEHLFDDSSDVIQGSERWVEISIDGNTVWDAGTLGDKKNTDNEYSLDNLPC